MYNPLGITDKNQQQQQQHIELQQMDDVDAITDED